MLPKNLLVTRKYKPNIWVEYVDLKESAPLAKRLISLFEQGTGKKYRELEEQAREFETFENFKLVRGLFTLLERRCTFGQSTSLDPKEIRSKLFLRGPVTSPGKRKKVLNSVAEEFGVSVRHISDFFWADREDEKPLERFDLIEPVELLKRYNLSLTQTLLFDAIEFNFKASGNYQEIFRAIKYYGLMYFLEGETNGYKVYVSGPASLFRKTRKYGTSLAKLIPYILRADKWEINAKIETKVGGESRIYNFSLDDSKKQILKVKKAGPQFDSATEESFAKRLKALRGDWKVRREPTVFRAGPYVFIPDFSFEKGDLVHYLEVVGFWTDEYLRKKIEKTKKVELPKNVRMTMAVNENLKCTRGDFERKEEDINVIFYNREIPVGPVVRILDKMELEKRLKEKAEIKARKLDQEIIKELRASKQEILELESIAKRYKVGVRPLRETLKKGLEKDDQLMLIERKVVSKGLLDRVKEGIDSLQVKTLANVQEILNQYDLSSEVLERMGYRVEFNSLDPSKVNVIKE